ncbi:WD40 repeat domain-containing protein [Candidatus Dependentiae bacterium]
MRSKHIFSKNLFIFLSFVFLFVCKSHANNCAYLSGACCQIGQLNLAGMCAQLILPGDTTIDEGGLYKLPQNTQGCITVDADDVLIDLCGATLHCPDSPAITILPGHTNVEIKNGKIEGTPDLANDGILTYSSCQLINIKDMKIYSCDSAIHFVGSEGQEIKACKIKDSEFYDCNKGIFFEYTKKCVCENCDAFNCIFVGFDQTYSKFNLFDNCKAFETSNGELDERAIGFSSFAGKGNLFTECVAEGTSKTADSLYCHGAIGFLLTGTEGKMETETKIVQCIANSTSVLSSGSGIAFGIKLEPVYTGTEFKDEANFGDVVNSVDWSPDGRYLAVGGEDEDNEIKIYKFDGTEFSDPEVDSVDFGNDVESVAWSPNGKYLAAGGTHNAAEIKAYSFDGSKLSQVGASVNFGDDVLSVDWSPDGKYLAVGGRDVFAQIKIYSFDGASLFQVGMSISFGDYVQSVNWSLDGKYLAASGVNNRIKVYSFDGANLEQVGASVDDFGGIVNSVKWSPDGKYLAAGGGPSLISGLIKVYSFDGANLEQVGASVDFGAFVRSVDWSPDGKYLAVGGEGEEDNIKIYSFDGTNLSPEEDVDFGSVVSSVDWSPCGRYIAGGAFNDLVRCYCAMDAPSRCLIDSNRVCNTSGGDGRHGIGISGSGDNFYISNVAYENDVNFNEAIHPRLGNTFGPKFISTPENYDNLFNG